MSRQITVERTGRIFSFAGVEYLVTFPNGDKVTVWSPPWGEDLDEKQKEDEAIEFSRKLWDEKSYTPLDRSKAREKFGVFFEEPALAAFLDKHWPSA